MIKVVILGPESTGKSTLANELAVLHNGGCVQEYAREYLGKIGRNYVEDDLLQIAKGQVKLEEYMVQKSIDKGYSIIFYDTDLTVLKIWSEYKFSQCHPWIIEQYSQRKYDLYLLTYPDIDWKADPLRENPDDLMKIFNLYQQDLRKRNVNYKIISGQGEKRVLLAVEAINDLLSARNFLKPD